MSDLIAHITSTHHAYTRTEIARLGPLFDKVCSVHGKNHPELLQVRASFRGLAQELTMHMMKEEMVLFPYISANGGSGHAGRAGFAAPVRQRKKPSFHDGTRARLRRQRIARHAPCAAAVTLPPPDACISYQTLYQALADFEADLHQHIHLENNILFPRAIAMEQVH